MFKKSSKDAFSKNTLASVREVRESVHEVWQSRRFLSPVQRVGVRKGRLHVAQPEFEVGADWERDLILKAPGGMQAFLINVRVDDEESHRKVQFTVTGFPVDKKAGLRAVEMMLAQLPTA